MPSSAMLPAFRAGERVTVLLDPEYTPSVGDVVAFHPPGGADSATPVCGNPQQGAGYREACSVPTKVKSTQVFIRRVVAAPGDVLQMRHGRVILNGETEQATSIIACDSLRRALHDVCSFPSPITIPPGHYFVLGDNRAASDDSRFWGPVRREWIIGKVVRGI